MRQFASFLHRLQEQWRQRTTARSSAETPDLPIEPGEWIKPIVRRLLCYGPVGVIIVILLLGWWNWKDIQERPGISEAIEFITRAPIPKADPQHFSIIMAHLENDPQGHMEQIVIEDLKEFEGIQVLRIDRTIEVSGGQPEAGEQEGHEDARMLLQRSGANAMLWGSVLRHEGRAVPKLHWTVAGEAQPARAFGRYRPLTETDLSLPLLFWEDLAQILRLLVVTESAKFKNLQGHYIADRLTPFVDRVRTLWTNRQQRLRWDRDTTGEIGLILANGWVHSRNVTFS
jgi:hypothetical protein